MANALLALMAALTVSVPGLAAENPTRTYKVKGPVTGIDPVRLTIQAGKDRTVTLHTAEDYRDRVLPGAQVTAWYRRQGEICKLDRLEYPREISFTPPAEFVPRIKKVILLPSSNAGDASVLFRALEQFLQARFNWFAAHRMLAEEIRRRYEKTKPAASNLPFRGTAPTPTPLPVADDALIQKIAAETRVDAVLEAQVEYLMVKLDSYTAAWDGARESLGSTGERAAARLTLRPVRGQVPATTVRLKLRDPQARPLWSQRRGFCLLAQRVEGSFRDRTITEAVADPAFMEAWLTEVFASWLPKSSSPTARR